MDWFDSDYYHILYKHRDYNEARNFIDNIIKYLNIKKAQKFWILHVVLEDTRSI